VTRHLALVGTTATGKSAVALALARQLGDVEIVSLDAMQVYREMDIGTAKPTIDERTEVPHHLVDVADPAEEWSVQRTQAAAHAARTEIEDRGKRAIFVGGTGLYVQAVLDALDVPGVDTERRAAIEAETSDAAGLARAYRRLVAVDPDAAARIEPGNRRRIVRALEVIDATGRRFSSFGPGLHRYGPPAFPVQMVGIWIDRARLADRVAERVRAMERSGLVDEVERLSRRPHGLGRTARQAIGYKEVLMHFEGRLSCDEALELTIGRTRQFARRQRVWFRRDPRIVWIGTRENPEDLADAVLATWCSQRAVAGSTPPR
jgi:tRNA dimethylallyltransferase